MNAQEAGLALSVLLAAGVEMVEALTIVLAVGVTRGWRSALRGVACALLVLAVIVAVLGPLLVKIPIDTLRFGVGLVLLYLGLTWLRKAVLRAAGRKAQRDEAQAFAVQSEAALKAGQAAPGKLDRYAFAVAFQGVFVEGLEVVFIVLSFGSGQHRVALAAGAALVAAAIVLAAGVLARRPLAAVPENAMKYAVGVLLTGFGIFWLVEGAGAHWPGDEASVPALLALVLAVSFGLVAGLRVSSR